MMMMMMMMIKMMMMLICPAVGGDGDVHHWIVIVADVLEVDGCRGPAWQMIGRCAIGQHCSVPGILLRIFWLKDVGG
jgi:hypothetical protein